MWKVVASHAEVERSIPGWAETAPIHSTYEALTGTEHEGGGETNEFDLQSLTPLSVAGCGLQANVPHWATSVYYCKYLIIDPTFCGSRFSTGRLLATEDLFK